MKSWKKVLILLLTTTFFLLLLIGSTVLLALGKIERVSEEESNRLEPSEEFFEQNKEENDYEFLDPEKVLLETAQEIIGGENGIINLLLIGQDNQSETERKRSDTMILCSLNARKKEITLVSFMRDMYVQIPGYSNNRINRYFSPFSN